MQQDQTAQHFKFQSVRFGEIDVDPSEILHFPEGLLGFISDKRFILLQDEEQQPFLWLQSLDTPDLAFIVVDPFLFFPGYDIAAKASELASIELSDVANATVLIIVTIPEDPMKLTGNLRGPLLINMENRKAKQLVLIDDRYTTKHSLLEDIPDYLATPPQANENTEPQPGKAENTQSQDTKKDPKANHPKKSDKNTSPEA